MKRETCDFSHRRRSYYTLSIAAGAVKHSKKHGKDLKLAVVVDDHVMMDDPEWYLHTDEQAMNTREIVERYFSDFELPSDFVRIMDNYGLTIDDIFLSKHGLAFQESRYREEFAKKFSEEEVGCAGEYALILQEFAERGVKSVFGLIPTVCQGPTCNAIGSITCQKAFLK